uniref:Uncharacterized protein n=1 Tax=Rhizophora mucronata TaxID=61149 RepID=A0A2P2NUK9_RHIMU
MHQNSCPSNFSHNSWAWLQCCSSTRCLDLGLSDSYASEIVSILYSCNFDIDKG